MGHGARGGGNTATCEGTPQSQGAGRGPCNPQGEAAADTDFGCRRLLVSGTVRESIFVALSNQGWGHLLQWQQDANSDPRIGVPRTWMLAKSGAKQGHSGSQR